jgi:hypothetical protein
VFTVELGSVAATGQVSTPAVNITEKLSSVSATPSIGTVSATGVIFDFAPYADLYSRQRAVVLVSEDDRTTVNVTADNRTVYILPEGNNNTVVIVPQNRTMFLSKQNNNTQTIKIAA